jgi:hypothetical protein
MLALDATVYVVMAIAISLAPLLVFTSRLVRLRRQGAHAYGALAKHFVDAFETRWLDCTSAELLDASSIQSLNDLGGSFERLQTMRVIVAPRVVLQTVVAAAVAPMVPLVVAEVGAATLLSRLIQTLL